MYIQELILENFASIFVAQNTRRIYIDFSTRKNKICLLVGPNGSGKSSLISMLTPFASIGNLDVRDSESLILDGENGYKEITIINKNDEYRIKHFYTPNGKSHSVKSYIEKNGDELNVNGNVRSFLAIVEDELGIKPSFLKLIRLGNNVTNLLQLSATERKKFLSTLLEELDVYLSFFKKLTDDSRLLKTQLSHLQDKIQKTGIEDLEKSKSLLSFLEKEIGELETEKESIVSNLGWVEKELKNYDPRSLSEENKTLSSKINRAEKALSKSNNCTLDECIKADKKEEDELSSLDKEISSLNYKISVLLDSLDNEYKHLKSIEREIDKEETNEELISAREIFFSLQKEMNRKSSSFENFRVSYTKEEIERLLSSLIKINDELHDTYEFGKEPVKRVISLLKGKKNVNNFVNNGILDYTSSSDASFSLLNKLLKDVNELEPTCDHKTCSIYSLWVQIRNLTKEEEVKRKTNDTVEFYQYVSLVNQRLKYIFDELKSLKSIIEKLPDKYKSDFLLDAIYSHIERLEPIYDKSKYNELYSEITEYDNYIKLCEDCEDAEKRYLLIEKTSKLDFFENERSKIKERIESLKEEIQDISDNIIPSLKRQYQEAKEKNEDTKDLIVALTDLNELKTQLTDTCSQITHFNELCDKKSELVEYLRRVSDNLKKKTDDKFFIHMGISQYESLLKDYELYSKRYDENSYIKRAMSSKEGMPLEYINMYMGDLKSVINDLLNIVYDGELEISDLQINSDEFRIPYYRGNYLISDILQASQGETAFLSIALSFALIYRSILNYNVILLDEVDGALDDEKRKKFIAILERLMEMIDAEQIFLITHNNLFSMYPVDVLSLSGEIDQKLQLGHYITYEKD